MSVSAPLKPAAFSTQIRDLGVEDGTGWTDHFGQALREALKDSESIKTLSLFAGGGGLDLGFHDAGFQIVEAVELEQKYAATLERNAKAGGLLDSTTIRCLDIRDYEPPADLDVDFIIGGPPCQTFSAAGRRASGVRGTSDERGTLFSEYVRLLEAIQPSAFLFENVYGIVGAEGGQPWSEIVAAFEGIGYNLSWRVLDSADYGVPQHRERLIIVGAREADYQFPRPSHGPDSADQAPFYSSGVAVGEAARASGDPSGVAGRYGHLLTEIPPGLNYSYFTDVMGHPKPVFAWRSKFSDFLYKADPERPVRTIKAQGGQYTGPFHWASRPFSVAELKRLQTIPDAYEVVGGRQIAIEQIGNSVPPQLARMLALTVREQIFSLDTPVSFDCLGSDEALGFRQRKRALTAHYRSVATDAIARRTEGPRQEVDRFPRARVLTERFGWREAGTAAGSRYEVRAEPRGDELDVLLIGEDQSADDEVQLEIRVEGSADRSWPIALAGARLRSTDSSRHALPAVWKAFEEAVRETFHLADLVQLNGYYQYQPRLSARVSIAPTDSAIWKMVRLVTEGVMVAQTAKADAFLDAWGLPADENGLVRLLRGLRGLGYEPRSHKTNPQIPKGSFLVPYSFPTLTPESVQLRKRL
jgi:DNA (cytosine-5)-methyltransferase 1